MARDAQRQPTPPSTRDIALSRAALFLDLDGTLAAFEATPDEVVADPRRTALLRRLSEALDGRLAIISGRPVQDIDRIVEGSCAFAAGVHGLERRGAAGHAAAAAHPELAATEAVLRAFAEARPGLLIESKALSVALHYRGAPELMEEARTLARRLAHATGLKLQEGDRVVELRTPGADKGHALLAFMAEDPFAGSVPIFVGDDLTDEDAFAAATSLGGLGVLVGPARPTSAAARLPHVAGVLDWLDRSAGSGVFSIEVPA